MPETAYKIFQTIDRAYFEEGAKMMAATDPWITLGMNYHDCLAAFNGECKEVYIVEMENVMAGFIILQVCGTFNGYVQSICVDKKYRNHGLGKILVKFAEERIYQNSPNVFICVSSFNEGAAKLYYSLGFEKIAVLKDFIKIGFDELLLRKTIGPRLRYNQKKNI